MIRRSFLKRMALAAAACAFIDVPWPKVRQFVGVRFTHYGEPMVFPLPAEWASDYVEGERVPITGADESFGTVFFGAAL